MLTAFSLRESQVSCKILKTSADNKILYYLQYTGMMLLEEMASIIVTPYLLIFVVPKVKLEQFRKEHGIWECAASTLSNLLF